MQPSSRRAIARLLALATCWLIRSADATQTPASVVEAARGAALAAARDAGVNNPTAEVATPDPRLRLADCAAPLAARLSGQSTLPGRAIAQVSCPAAPGWSVHLPVSVRAKAAVLVAARPLPRGYRVQASDLARQTQELGILNGQYLLDTEAVVGQVLRRSVGAGERLSAALLQPPLLVRRGEPVQMQLQSANFVIHATGRAMADGIAGQRVGVENPTSKRVVQGTVTADGKVTVEF